MMAGRRIFIGTVTGFAAGIICWLGGRYGLKDDISTAMLVYILASRTLIGFVIGVSRLRLHWALHGSVMGAVVGLPFAAGCLLEPDNWETALAALVLGAVYGLLIELVTAVLFKAPPDGGRETRPAA